LLKYHGWKMESTRPTSSFCTLKKVEITCYNTHWVRHTFLAWNVISIWFWRKQFILFWGLFGKDTHAHLEKHPAAPRWKAAGRRDGDYGLVKGMVIAYNHVHPERR
ncbi:hypothetical protein VIGAN_11114400, partial [Vigna angularis var. angularis]